MAAKKITVNTNTDFHRYVPFYRNGAALDVSTYQFKLKFLDRNGADVVSIDGVADTSLTNRVWFNSPQALMAELPSTGVAWYLLAKDPDNYVILVRSGSATVKGGAAWS